jgi:hypothetical protein
VLPGPGPSLRAACQLFNKFAPYYGSSAFSGKTALYRKPPPAHTGTSSGQLAWCSVLIQH